MIYAFESETIAMENDGTKLKASLKKNNNTILLDSAKVQGEFAVDMYVTEDKSSDVFGKIQVDLKTFFCCENHVFLRFSDEIVKNRKI